MNDKLFFRTFLRCQPSPSGNKLSIIVCRVSLVCRSSICFVVNIRRSVQCILINTYHVLTLSIHSLSGVEHNYIYFSLLSRHEITNFLLLCSITATYEPRLSIVRLRLRPISSGLWLWLRVGTGEFPDRNLINCSRSLPFSFECLFSHRLFIIFLAPMSLQFNRIMTFIIVS